VLEDVVAGAARAVEYALETAPREPRLREVGTVTHVSGGVARLSGLPGLRSEELLVFAGGTLGIAVNLDPHEVGSVLLGDSAEIAAGMEVRGTGRLADAPVGEGLLGRVLDATGRPLDDLGPLRVTERWPVERDAPAILDRAPVAVPLQTGLKVVDALVPIGRGQRELIVGDRQTGKTAVAVDTIVHQRGRDVVCIYCAIGQRGTSVARVVETLRSTGALEYTVVVVAPGEQSPGLQFITPYAATAMGEYFMAHGRDVLIVYDDLTRHARAYRELSLLLRRPPGREAYPGDIFYIHSRLLERATRLSQARGGGSLTALPIVETQAQDISAYIPTNLISITDGQIYLSPELFRKGVLPAVDVGKSVSRVGGKTQLAPYRAVVRDLRLTYAQFEELESFARFATRLDERTRETLERGQRLREVLKQPELAPLTVAEQLAVLRALNAGLFDDIPVEAIAAAERAVQAALHEGAPDLAARLDAGDAPGEEEWQQLLAHARAAIRGVAATDPVA
jgi:F-type H+-transporting ATPase subunit alpha